MRIALIDDDEAVLDSLALYLARKQVVSERFASADEFLARTEGLNRLDCIVADVRMPGMSGIDLTRYVGTHAAGVPIILITGHGDIDMAVAAIKSGAFDFIEKPFDEARLLDSLAKAASQRTEKRKTDHELTELRARYDGLTKRQREVMEHAALGLSNKEIGLRLGISPRTVEIHRAWMMERLGAKGVAELVRIYMNLK